MAWRERLLANPSSNLSVELSMVLVVGWREEPPRLSDKVSSELEKLALMRLRRVGLAYGSELVWLLPLSEDDEPECMSELMPRLIPPPSMLPGIPRSMLAERGVRSGLQGLDMAVLSRMTGE